MDKLKQANLYRNELIPVKGKLVERYNKCLQKLGLSTTKLSTFSIDGLGWSPEIAEEKQNDDYLNNGEANPHGIIITPAQKGIAIYNPFHSYDKEVMKMVWKTHQEKIKNITRDSALCLDFDQKIDVFYEPLDVLSYTDVTVKFRLIDNLEKAKEEQLKLIETFHRDNNFIDEDLHQQLIASAKKYGDLRERDISLTPVVYTSDSFYTKAFGGIFLLRNFVTPILIFEAEETYKEAINDTTHDVLMFHISQPELIKQLKEHVIIECNLEQEVETKRYSRIKKYLFAKAIEEPQHAILEILKDNTLFKSYLNKIDIKNRKKVMCVERYLSKKQVNKDVRITDFVDDDFYFALHKPHSSLRANHQDLIWQLLLKITAKDVLFWYWYHKNDFYNQFQTWDESFQNWVIEEIQTGF